MKRKRVRKAECFRLDPSIRLCPNFDASSMALFPIAEKGREMGFVVEDNFPEEHIQ